QCAKYERLSLHEALPIYVHDPLFVINIRLLGDNLVEDLEKQAVCKFHDVVFGEAGNFFAVMTAREFKRVADNLFRAGPRNNLQTDRKSTRLNSSHQIISY